MAAIWIQKRQTFLESYPEMTDHELQIKAVALRRAMLKLIVGAGAGHTGGGAFGNYFGWEVYNHNERSK